MQKNRTRTVIILLTAAAVILLLIAGIGLFRELRKTEIPDTPKENSAPIGTDIPQNRQISTEIPAKDVPHGRKRSETLLRGIFADDMECVFVKEERCYYLPVSPDSIGDEMGIELYFWIPGNGSVVFQNEEILPQSTFQIETDREYLFYVYNETDYQQCCLRFTTLPILSIETERSIGTSDTACSIRLLDGNRDAYGGEAMIESNAAIRIRGATSASLLKKPYRLSLKEQDGTTPCKRSLLGLRSDDDWILDAMYIDPTRMHNHLAIELWNEFTAGHYPATNTPAASGKYVEVVINGEYMGLYDLLEPVDRKQLNLDPDDGFLIKSFSWEGAYFEKAAPFPTSGTWLSFELKYPKNPTKKELHHIWSDFYQLHQATVQSEKDPETFYELAQLHLDRENITDYWIFITAFQMRDNRGKNLYWSSVRLSDNPAVFYITPWDCDCAFGYRYWPGTLPRKRDEYFNQYTDDFRLLKQYLEYDIGDSRALLRQKWEKETRENGILSLENLYRKIDQYRTLLTESGAWDRETKRWPASMPADPEEEFEYMKTWLADRYDYMETLLEPYRETN